MSKYCEAQPLDNRQWVSSSSQLGASLSWKMGWPPAGDPRVLHRGDGPAGRGGLCAGDFDKHGVGVADQIPAAPRCAQGDCYGSERR